MSYSGRKITWNADKKTDCKISSTGIHVPVPSYGDDVTIVCAYCKIKIGKAPPMQTTLEGHGADNGKSKED